MFTTTHTARLRSKIHRATDEFIHGLGEAGGSLQKAATHAVPAAREQFDRAADRLSDYKADLRGWFDSTTDRERTMGAILCVGGIGLLTWWWLRRRGYIQ